jgi:hypothetical protein
MRIGLLRQSTDQSVQVRFQISSSGIVLQRPPPFTTCIQEAADGSWWMFPCSENEGWLCAKKLGV